jgi:hypothetical protein
MALVVAIPAALAGHEVSYYPSFYPQEIRIEPLAPEAAAKEFLRKNDPLHVYIGESPRFEGTFPVHLKSVASLRSFIVATFNLKSPRVSGREARCRAVESTAASLVAMPDLVRHAYPVTPYHADYIAHADRIPSAQAPNPPASSGLDLRIEGGSELVKASLAAREREWDLRLDEIPLEDLMRKAGGGLPPWPKAPWLKEGWFQAYHLLRPAVGDPKQAELADEAYERLTRGEFNGLAERLNLERALVTSVTAGCERAVVGYRLRQEFYSDDSANGVENIAFDSQSGFNSPVFVRTIKLKDFPWNGWLRVGVAGRPLAAWNPVAGFSDAIGRLVWATVGDDAFLPAPFSSGWAANRVEIRAGDGSEARRSLLIPADALLPRSGTGELLRVGEGKGAAAKVTYRVAASAFQDGTEMDVADIYYPYVLAFRWGAPEANGAVFDPELAAATRLMRERLRAVRVIDVEVSTLAMADLVFIYQSPIVEVYLDGPPSTDADQPLVAPPWSSVPWHVLALMEAAVERGIAAFSRSEAERRGLPWLELARDVGQKEKMAALIREFAVAGYRPPALADLVSSEAAKARWQALGQFLEANGHLMVTNGPYRLKSFTPEAITFDVVREFTYPVGLGTFNFYAHPPHAVVTNVERSGEQVMVTADVELAVKAQRNRISVRQPLKRETLRETNVIQPTTRYLVVGGDGAVVAAGSTSWQPDGRFAFEVPAKLPAGKYTAFVGIFLDGNALHPSIGRIQFERN